MARQQTFQRKNVYRDFDLSFNINPLTRDIGVKTDVNAINQAIRTLINTNFYERAFHPEIGSNIKRILFEPVDPITTADLRRAITETITNHEPRVTLVNIIVADDPDRNRYNITIIYRINTVNEPIELNVALERLR